MTSPFLALEGVSHVLPDGRMLFSELNEQFDVRPTGWSAATAWARPSWRAHSGRRAATGFGALRLFRARAPIHPPTEERRRLLEGF